MSQLRTNQKRQLPPRRLLAQRKRQPRRLALKRPAPRRPAPRRPPPRRLPPKSLMLLLFVLVTLVKRILKNTFVVTQFLKLLLSTKRRSLPLKSPRRSRRPRRLPKNLTKRQPQPSTNKLLKSFFFMRIKLTMVSQINTTHLKGKIPMPNFNSFFMRGICEKIYNSS